MGPVARIDFMECKLVAVDCGVLVVCATRAGATMRNADATTDSIRAFMTNWWMDELHGQAARTSCS
jgi:hypothetical protein